MTTNDTRTAKERAEELAAIVPPVVQYRRPIFIDGYLACHADTRSRDAEPTTVTAEQIDALGKWFLRYHTPTQDHGEIDRLWDEAKTKDAITWMGTWADPHLSDAREALLAAGFRIEGDEA